MRAFQAHILNKVNYNETSKQLSLKQKNIMIIFGSGGHTTEMLMMVGDMNIFEKYGHIHIVIAVTDTWSERKLRDFY